jgi:outer membrane biosynthesis protein TonB
MIASVMNTNLLETTMNKQLTVIAATLLAVTAIASGAEAGFNVRIKAPAGFSEVHKAGCGGGGGASSYRRAASQSVRRSKPRVQVASRTVSKPAVVAKAETEAPAAAEPAEEPEKVAKIENSSVTTEEEVAETDTPKTEKKVAEIKKPKAEKKIAEKSTKKAEQKVAAAGELGCKTFFASVGMTLSVPCDKN